MATDLRQPGTGPDPIAERARSIAVRVPDGAELPPSEPNLTESLVPDTAKTGLVVPSIGSLRLSLFEPRLCVISATTSSSTLRAQRLVEPSTLKSFFHDQMPVPGDHANRFDMMLIPLWLADPSNAILRTSRSFDSAEEEVGGRPSSRSPRRADVPHAQPTCQNSAWRRCSNRRLFCLSTTAGAGAIDIQHNSRPTHASSGPGSKVNSSNVF